MTDPRPCSTVEEIRRQIDEAHASLSSLGDDLREAYEQLKDARREDRENKRANYLRHGGEYFDEENAERTQQRIYRIQEGRDRTRELLVKLKAELRARGAQPRIGVDSSADPRFAGTVKWYSAEKGFGFISVEGQPDVFVAKGALRESTSLETGDRVTFKRTQGQKGFKAVDVRYVAG